MSACSYHLNHSKDCPVCNDELWSNPPKASWLHRLVRFFFHAKPRRIDLRFVSYADGDKLVRDGWTIAKEEDTNRVIGMVWLELLEKSNHRI